MCTKTPPASQSLTKTEISAEKCEARGSSFKYEISGFHSLLTAGWARADCTNEHLTSCSLNEIKN